MAHLDSLTQKSYEKVVQLLMGCIMDFPSANGLYLGLSRLGLGLSRLGLYLGR